MQILTSYTPHHPASCPEFYRTSGLFLQNDRLWLKDSFVDKSTVSTVWNWDVKKQISHIGFEPRTSASWSQYFNLLNTWFYLLSLKMGKLFTCCFKSVCDLAVSRTHWHSWHLLSKHLGIEYLQSNSFLDRVLQILMGLFLRKQRQKEEIRDRSPRFALGLAPSMLIAHAHQEVQKWMCYNQIFSLSPCIPASFQSFPHLALPLWQNLNFRATPCSLPPSLFFINPPPILSSRFYLQIKSFPHKGYSAGHAHDPYNSWYTISPQHNYGFYSFPHLTFPLFWLRNLQEPYVEQGTIHH